MLSLESESWAHVFILVKVAGCLVTPRVRATDCFCEASSYWRDGRVPTSAGFGWRERLMRDSACRSGSLSWFGFCVIS